MASKADAGFSAILEVYSERAETTYKDAFTDATAVYRDVWPDAAERLKVEVLDRLETRFENGTLRSISDLDGVFRRELELATEWLRADFRKARDQDEHPDWRPGKRHLAWIAQLDRKEFRNYRDLIVSFDGMSDRERMFMQWLPKIIVDERGVEVRVWERAAKALRVKPDAARRLFRTCAARLEARFGLNLKGASLIAILSLSWLRAQFHERLAAIYAAHPEDFAPISESDVSISPSRSTRARQGAWIVAAASVVVGAAALLFWWFSGDRSSVSGDAPVGDTAGPNRTATPSSDPTGVTWNGEARGNRQLKVAQPNSEHAESSTKASSGAILDDIRRRIREYTTGTKPPDYMWSEAQALQALKSLEDVLERAVTPRQRSLGREALSELLASQWLLTIEGRPPLMLGSGEARGAQRLARSKLQSTGIMGAFDIVADGQDPTATYMPSYDAVLHDDVLVLVPRAFHVQLRVPIDDTLTVQVSDFFTNAPAYEVPHNRLLSLAYCDPSRDQLTCIKETGEDAEAYDLLPPQPISPPGLRPESAFGGQFFIRAEQAFGYRFRSGESLWAQLTIAVLYVGHKDADGAYRGQWHGAQPSKDGEVAFSSGEWRMSKVAE